MEEGCETLQWGEWWNGVLVIMMWMMLLVVGSGGAVVVAVDGVSCGRGQRSAVKCGGGG